MAETENGRGHGEGPTLPAVHEASHAVAYLSHRRRFRYVTLRPRTHGLDGIVRVRPARIEATAKMVIAAAGPVGEAMHSEALDIDHDYDYADHLAAAYLSGGHGDDQDIQDAREFAGGVTQQMAEEIAAHLLRQRWAAVARLAAALDQRRTITYADAVRLVA